MGRCINLYAPNSSHLDSLPSLHYWGWENTWLATGNILDMIKNNLDILHFIERRKEKLRGSYDIMKNVFNKCVLKSSFKKNVFLNLDHQASQHL